MTVAELLASPPAADDYEYKKIRYRAARVLHEKDARYDSWFYVTQWISGACQFSRGEVQPDGTMRYPEHVKVTRGRKIQRM